MPNIPPLDSKRSRVLAAVLCPILLVAAGYGWLLLFGPTPFSFKGDMYTFAFPLAKLSGQSWANLHVPTLDWGLGDGMNPWLMGQSGVLYPVNPLAFLAAKVLGRPLLLMEALAVLNLLILAFSVFHHPLFRKQSVLDRALLASLAAFHPAILIQGQNWCYVLSMAAWAAISTLWVLAWRRWPSERRFAWLSLASLAMTLVVSHVQVYIFFLVLIPLPLAVAGVRKAQRMAARPFFLIFAACTFPVFIGLWLASQDANPAWMAGRDAPDFILSFAQTLPTVLKGTILGNLPGSRPTFQLWEGVSPLGSGMFWLPPALFLGLWSARKKDRLLLGGILGAMLLLMGNGSLPFMRYFFIGPFAGFRWTFKFAIFIPALLLTAAAMRRPTAGALPWRWALVASLPMMLWMDARGLQVDFTPSLARFHQGGIQALAGPALELKSRLKLQPGERVVPVGRMSMVDPAPPAWIAVAANCPAVFGMSSLALVDPLESAASARFRGGLSFPWRTAIPDSIDGETFGKAEAFLGPQGARVYVFKRPPAFSTPAAEAITTSDGGTVWAVRSARWEPRLKSADGRSGPDPSPWGEWQVPSGTWTLATARSLEAPGMTVEKGHPFQGPASLSFSPLGPEGAWMRCWYLALTLAGLGVWWFRSPLVQQHVGLLPPHQLPAAWRRMTRAAKAAWLILGIPLSAMAIATLWQL